MPSVLGLIAEKFIEACWLLAVVVTPLFFNLHSRRVFEADKLTLLRSVALVMILAAAVRLLEHDRSTIGRHSSRDPSPETRGWPFLHRIWQGLRQLPILVPIVFYAGVQFLATVTSVAPSQSLWGSYLRLQGAYSLLAYMTVFASLLVFLRTRQQFNRLIHAAILVSLPAALYGILQHAALDPLAWRGADVVQRSASSLGNPIYLGAYLLMIVPVTLTKFIAAIKSRRASGSWNHIAAAAFGLILLVEIAAILFTQSRGPWLGLLASLFAFALLWALASGHQRTARTIVGAAVVLTAIFGIISLPNTPLSFARELPFLGRLSRIFETAAGGSVRPRVLIWEGAARLVSPHPPIWSPTEGDDPLNGVRPLIGYGPESIELVFNPFFPAELFPYGGHNETVGRCHNETFDALLEGGLLGLFGHLLLFVSLFCFGLRRLGLIGNLRQRNLFLALWLAGGLLTVLAVCLVDRSWRFFGVALPAGQLFGLIVYLALCALTRAPRQGVGTSSPPTAVLDGEQASRLVQGVLDGEWLRRLLIVGLLAGLIGHYVEIQFGIAVTATRTLFWVLTGLLILIGTGRLNLQRSPTPLTEVPPDQVVNDRRARRKRRSGKRGGARTQVPRRASGVLQTDGVLAAYGVVMAIILVTLSNDFGPMTADADSVHYWAVGLLLLATALLGGVIAVGEMTGEAQRRGHVTGGLRYLLGVALCLTLFIVVERPWPWPGKDISVIHSRYLVFILFMALFLSLILVRSEASRGGALARGRFLLLHSALTVGTGWLLIVANLNPVRADVYYQQAWNALHYQGQLDRAIRLCERAIGYAPREDHYYLFLGKALLEKGQSVTDPKQRDPLIDRGRQALEEARGIKPLDTNHTAALGRLFRIWAEHTTEQLPRRLRFQRSVDYFAQATRLSPNAARLYNEWSMTYAGIGDLQKASETVLNSLTLDQGFAETYVRQGDVYRLRQAWKEAEEAYQSAVGLEPRNIEAHSALGYVYVRQGRREEAIAENRAVLALAPASAATYQNLATLYAEMGRLDEALTAARTMQQLTLPGRRSQADALVSDLEARRRKAAPTEAERSPR